VGLTTEGRILMVRWVNGGPVAWEERFSVEEAEQVAGMLLREAARARAVRAS